MSLLPQAPRPELQEAVSTSFEFEPYMLEALRSLRLKGRAQPALQDGFKAALARLHEDAPEGIERAALPLLHAARTHMLRGAHAWEREWMLLTMTSADADAFKAFYLRVARRGLLVPSRGRRWDGARYVESVMGRALTLARAWRSRGVL